MAIEGIPHTDSDRPRSDHSIPGAPARVGQDVILVIDDDTDVLNSVRRLLRREGWVVLTAYDLEIITDTLASTLTNPCVTPPATTLSVFSRRHP